MHHFADCWRAILSAAEGVLCLEPAAASSDEAAAADGSASLVRPDLEADCRAALSAADGVRCLVETSPVDSASWVKGAKFSQVA